MTNADVAWYVEQMWEMHPMILNKLEMMEHTLEAMEQQMMDMGALHQRELSTQRHLSLQREWQHRHTSKRMQKEMGEMKQTMLKMQEMLKMKSKAKNHWLERSVRFVDEAERQACDQPNLVAAVGKAVGGEEVLTDRSHDQFPSFDHLLSVIWMVEE